MTDDLLESASRALREESDGGSDSARFTRARVMASLHQRKRRRTTKIAFLVPIAAVLVGSTAWGAATGRLSTRPPEPPAPLARPAERGAELVRRAVRSHAAPVERAIEAPAPAPAAAETPAQRAEAPAPVRAPAAASALQPEPNHELYRVAHRKHFSESDPAGALTAWDAYLAAAPHGRFATEARYNRALCLVRLGRNGEAVAALEPFASGRVGGYRQREASELSAALGR